MTDPEESIRALIGAYATLLDAGDLDGVAGLFAHGTFRSARGGPNRTGTEEVRATYDPVVIYDDGTPRTKHVLGNIEITLDSSRTTATSWCTFSVLQAVPSGPLAVVLAGRYEDRFECIEGTWRFAERVVHPDLLGDLAQHMRRREGPVVIDGPAAIADAALARERPGGATTVIGITGSVAVGKSAIAAEVAEKVRARGRTVEVISTDAFLLPNAMLVDRGLLLRKGFPESYDHEALRSLVDGLHTGTKRLTVPIYSHLAFDIVAGDLHTLADAELVVIEGVNVLTELHDVLDLSVYIDAPERLVEEWYVDRFHALCREAEQDEHSFYRQFVGMSSDQIDQLARRTWEGINLVNLRENIAPSGALADLVVTMGTGHEVESMNSREDLRP